MLNSTGRLADHDGGFEVEASLGLDGPSVAVSKTLRHAKDVPPDVDGKGELSET
jgi:hypothetical protein